MHPKRKTRTDYHDLASNKPLATRGHPRWFSLMLCILLGFMMGVVYTKRDLPHQNQNIATNSERISSSTLAAVDLKKNQVAGKGSVKSSKV